MSCSGSSACDGYFSCSICCVDDLPLASKFVLKKCSHECCIDCLTKLVRANANAGGDHRLLCPFCRTKVSKKDISRARGAANESQTTTEANNSDSENEIDEYTRHWLEEHTRPCPSCGTCIERRSESLLLESGSNGMRCPCGCSFCYSCGLESQFCICTSTLNNPFALEEEEEEDNDSDTLEDLILEQENNTLMLQHAQTTSALVSMETLWRRLDSEIEEAINLTTRILQQHQEEDEGRQLQQEQSTTPREAVRSLVVAGHILLESINGGIRSRQSSLSDESRQQSRRNSRQRGRSGHRGNDGTYRQRSRTRGRNSRQRGRSSPRDDNDTQRRGSRTRGREIQGGSTSLRSTTDDEQQGKTTYNGVTHNGGTGRLCFTSNGLIYYPATPSGMGEKVKMGWRSVSRGQGPKFHPLCLALEVNHRSRNRSHFFGIKDAQDFHRMEQDLAMRLIAYNRDQLN